jgi:hypothetical protein
MAEADRGRHPGFPRFNGLASGPSSLAERSAQEERRMQRQLVKLGAAYHQFYLGDEGAGTEAPVDWTNEDVDRHMKTAESVVVVCPVVEDTVPVEIEVHENEPPYDADEWDHIVESSLQLPSGRLVIEEWPNRAVARFAVTSGCYRVRAFFGNLRSALSDEEPSQDFYKVVLWPAPFADLHVVKQLDWQKLIEETGMENSLGKRVEPRDATGGAPD